MSTKLKIILIVVGTLVGLLVLTEVVLRFFVDVNAHKPRLEAAASRALSMEVKINGPLSIGFFPGLSVVARDVHLRNRNTDVASADEARLGIDLLPLLQGQVRIGRIALQHPRLDLERDRDGRFNVGKQAASGAVLPTLDLTRLSVSNGTLRYADTASGRGFESVDCNLEVRPLHLAGGLRTDLMRTISFTANLACREIRNKDYVASDVKISVSGKQGVFDFKPVVLRLFGGQGSGELQADFTGAVPRYHLRYSLTQWRIEDYFKTRSPRRVAQGPMDFSATLSMQGENSHALRQTLAGQLSLRGGSITLNGRDLDAEISRFESSQNFNLVDVGAFIFAGPVGLVATKGYDFAGLLRSSEGSSLIRTLVTDWQIEGGMAQAQDVAMATRQHRMVLKGRLDIVNQRFDDVTLALIDRQGCATVRQKLQGSFAKPQVEPPSILKSLGGPALHLLKQGRDLFPGGECPVFYTGSVAPP